MTSPAIAVSGLRKAYKDKVVLDGIDLDVRAGTVFSLLGPNGAGKTTTVNVLTTLVKADGGTVRVAGHDVATQAKAVRAAIGVTGQFAAVDELLTGRENLQLMVDLSRVPAKGCRHRRRATAQPARPLTTAEIARIRDSYPAGLSPQRASQPLRLERRVSRLDGRARLRGAPGDAVKTARPPRTMAPRRTTIRFSRATAQSSLGVYRHQ
ncbi:ATP-binding cassette domain-containing protein [Micromonospora sp. NPDC047548]|uniref:ATP-binding cassette domain-containing protein n=1 Tax=Micromonospora sp. NPDC047548 TaxID=3155624 RepID=UPI00340AFC3A